MIEVTQISVNRFLRAGESSLLPKSPEGFIVAIKKKRSFAYILTNPLFSY